MHARTDLIATVAIVALSIGTLLHLAPPTPEALVSATQVFSCTLPAGFALFVAWKYRRPGLTAWLVAAFLVWATCPVWSSYQLVFDLYTPSLSYILAVKGVKQLFRLLPFLGTHLFICVAQCAALVVLWRPLQRWFGSAPSEVAIVKQRRVLSALIACFVAERGVNVAHWLLYMLSDGFPPLPAMRAMRWALVTIPIPSTLLIAWTWRSTLAARHAPAGRCGACGYDNAADSPACAECGVSSQVQA